MQTKTKRRRARHLSLAFFLLWLQACGGGSDAASDATAGAAPPLTVAGSEITALAAAPTVTIPPLAPIAPLAPTAPLPPIAPLAPTAPLPPIAPITPTAPTAPIAPDTADVAAPSPSRNPSAGNSGQEDGKAPYQAGAVTITPTVYGATGSTIYYSDTITITDLPPGVSIHCIATGAGYVDAGADALTGTYGPVVKAFEVGSSGTLVFKVQGIASATPGATAIVTVSVTTFSGYAATYKRGTTTKHIFAMTTAH